MARPNKLRDAKESETQILQARTEPNGTEVNTFFPSEQYTIHDLLETLFVEFEAEDDKDGILLVAAIGKHIYDKRAKGLENGRDTDPESD